MSALAAFMASVPSGAGAQADDAKEATSATDSNGRTDAETSARSSNSGAKQAEDTSVKPAGAILVLRPYTLSPSGYSFVIVVNFVEVTLYDV